jgi:SAM-dependent methyltransferase
VGAGGWWTTFFEGPALELWRRALPPEVTRGQASEIERALRLERGERVLDVPCGNGRIALELASRGYASSGLDLASDFVAEGLERAAERGVKLDLRQGDMRELPWVNDFDAAFCMGNSFGYLDDRGNRDFLGAVARSLRPGGRFLLDYPLVAELALARREYRDWHLLGDRLLLSDGRFEPVRGRLETTYTFVDLSRPGGDVVSRPASYAVYTAREVTELLRAAGFEGIELWGALDGTVFELRSSAFYARACRAAG